MIAIIDYGTGNLRSVQKGFEKVGHKAVVTSDPAVVKRAEKIVLPGVGTFKDAMQRIETLGLKDVITSFIKLGKPYLGICLGLHLLFSLSDEFGLYRGFDILRGKVKRFSHNLKIPHMGWNKVKFRTRNSKLRICEGIQDGTYFYFAHSYYVEPEDESVIAATTEYGVEFPSIVWRENLYATQFHPEKSQKAGLFFLKAFGDMR